jgi:hypothetical protein
VALVPSVSNLNQPAWPQALQHLRDSQLPDGGWGSASVYYAHGRTICTLAALWALLEWGHPADEPLIAAGVKALHHYAPYMASEPYQPIGFELLLPNLIKKLEKFDLDLPANGWTSIKKLTDKKLALIGFLKPDYHSLRSWWFNLEMLSEEQLAEIDDRILNNYGSIATSPAATAAYLRAQRLSGKDSPQAANFLERVLRLSGGGAGVCYPIEKFELIWILDALRRIGFSPNSKSAASLIKKLAGYWSDLPNGLSWSESFNLPDGDHTAVAFSILSWAGLNPDDHAFRRFWGKDYHLTYPDELGSSVSANVHALTALRYRPADKDYRDMGIKITHWLHQQMSSKGQFHDKWHFSPLYATARAISALSKWDDVLAAHCMDYVLGKQHKNGGWGSNGQANLEETSYSVLGLAAAWENGLLNDDEPLRLADAFLKKHGHIMPTETFWIGKSLYQPIGVAQAYVFAAQAVLEKHDIDSKRPSLWATATISQSSLWHQRPISSPPPSAPQ